MDAPDAAPAALRFKTGCSVQASTGVGIGEVEGEVFGESLTLSDTSWLLGVGAGCDYVQDRFIVGALGRVDWSGVSVADELDFGVSWTVAARAGVIVAPHVAVYALGGAVWTDIDHLGSTQGWVFGAGTEILITSNVSAILEYSRQVYDSEEVIGLSVDPSSHVVRAGLGLRF
jgi:opacity protein-like surface antigen